MTEKRQQPNSSSDETPTSPQMGGAAGAGDLERISRDERNLATYPIAMLSYQRQHGKTISQTRERRHPLTKKPVTATWEVLGSEKYGLPTPTDDAVVLVLMEISREQGFPQEVHFTQLDVLKRLGWPDNSNHYRKLESVFERLNAITIQSKNVFWDGNAKAFVNTGFHLIETFKIISKPGRRKSANGELALSWFQWGEPLWRSFKDGNLKPISLDFYFSLNLPVARRLYRFLDLVRYDGKPRYRIGLRKLCEEYLGLTHSPYPSVYKKVLAPGHLELINEGYLRNVTYEEAKTGGENVVYEFLPAKSPVAGLPTAGIPGAAGTPGPYASPTARPVLSPLDIALSLEIADTERHDGACDAVFHELPLEEQDRIHKRAKSSLAPFLQENMNTPGAKRQMQRETRQIVGYEHADAVTAYLKSQIENADVAKEGMQEKEEPN